MKCTIRAGECLIECGASAILMLQAVIVLLCATAVSHSGTVQLQIVTVPLKLKAVYKLAMHVMYTMFAFPYLNPLFVLKTKPICCLQLPLDFVEPIMSSQMHDWEYIAVLEPNMRILEAEGMFAEAPPSAADSIFTEALWYTTTAERKFKQRLHQGLNGRLEFAGLYAGIAAKYAYYCTLGKREDVRHHFGTQSWEPVRSELLVLGQPPDAEDVSEGLAYAEMAWAVMQEEPKLLTYGARG